MQPRSRLLAGIPSGAYVYFTHSYRAPLCADTVATCTYEEPFTAAAERGNLFGVQFHPEKSGDVGLQDPGELLCPLKRWPSASSPVSTSTAGRVVKGIQFVQLRDAGDPAELAAAHSAGRGRRDRLARHHGDGGVAQHSARNRAADGAAAFIPFTVGGGIRSLDDAAAVLDCGADKVAINSAAIADPALITQDC